MVFQAVPTSNYFDFDISSKLVTCFFFVSLALMLLSNRRYTIFEDNIKIGYAKDKWVSAIRNFMIHDDLYYMSTHKNEKFSLLKNGKQIASYSKEPVVSFQNS